MNCRPHIENFLAFIFIGAWPWLGVTLPNWKENKYPSFKIFGCSKLTHTLTLTHINKLIFSNSCNIDNKQTSSHLLHLRPSFDVSLTLMECQFLNFISSFRIVGIIIFEIDSKGMGSNG